MAHITTPYLKEFYETSPMREGLLNWYPFKKNASVLLIGTDALLNLLNYRCYYVEFVESEYLGNKKFDYLVVIDPGEKKVDLLKKYYSYLKKNGRLLLAFENPYGIQYFAGKRNPRTNKPFTFSAGESKAEVHNRLKEAGFKVQKWYYPFTNHYFAREIYSENYLPNEFLNHRRFEFIENDSTKAFDESSLWQEIIRGGAFEFLCGAYLVEANVCENDKPCMVNYAATTPYREPMKAFATIINDNGTVVKEALYPEGIEQLRNMEKNHIELAKLGVNVILVKLSGNKLTMEQIKFPTLWDYLTEKLEKNNLSKEELFHHFDKIVDAIKKSSKSGKLYWELVPANCFYDEKKDELLFFDQEYCWENVDVKIGIMRGIYALIYSHIFSKHPKTKKWLIALKTRYNLIDDWSKEDDEVIEKMTSFVFNYEESKPYSNAITNASIYFNELIAETQKKQERYKKILKVVNILKDKNFKKIAIYGYGLRGRTLRHVLSDYSFEISCIVDKGDKQVQGISYFKQIEDIKSIDFDTIIVTPLHSSNEIAKEINEKINCKTLILEEIING